MTMQECGHFLVTTKPNWHEVALRGRLTRMAKDTKSKDIGQLI
jgi:hypothetical protein